MDLNSYIQYINARDYDDDIFKVHSTQVRGMCSGFFFLECEYCFISWEIVESFQNIMM